MESLLIAIAANTLMIFSMKRAETADAHRKSVVLCNYLFGACFIFLFGGGLALGESAGTGSGFALQGLFSAHIGIAAGLALVNACLMTTCLLLQQSSLRTNGAGITTTYNRLGILIPTLLSALLFREYPTVLKAFGIALAIAAVLYSCEKESDQAASQNADSRKKNYGLLALVFLTGGCIDFISKVFGILCQPELKTLYTFVTFLLCAVIMLVVILVQKEPLTRKDVAYGALIGIPNVGITFSMVSAAAVLPAYIVFPVYSGAVIIIINLASVVLFKERLTKREIIATAMIATALVLLNL